MTIHRQKLHGLLHKMPQRPGQRHIRAIRPGRLGNPFRVGIDGSQKECVEKFRTALLGDSWAVSPPKGWSPAAFQNYMVDLAFRLEELAKSTPSQLHLYCFCGQDEPCHVDVEIEYLRGQHE